MKLLWTILTLSISLQSFSQVIEFGKDGTFSNNWHEGMLVLNDGSQKEGLVKFETAVSKMYGMKMTRKIRFKANEDAKKEKFKGKKVDYFVIKNNSGNYEKYSYERLSKRHLLLLRVLAEGKMNLYSEDAFNTIPGFSGGYPVKNLYIKMKGEKYVEHSKTRQLFKSFKKSSAEYFSDCSSVMSKINNETYQSEDIIQIVNEYNNCF